MTILSDTEMLNESSEKGLILDGHKLAWHQDRVHALKRGERVAPITIDCALTRACTYRCAYCYGQLQQNLCRNLDKKIIFDFLDDCAEIGVKAVSFVSDGESTCSLHLNNAILHGRANGLDMALGTNGYLLQDDRLDEILPALTYLRFNISAAEKDAYCRVHGCSEKAFHKVIGTIRKAVAVKKENRLDVTIGLQMVLLPEYENQVIPLAEFGLDAGVDYLVIKHCSDDENGRLGVDYSAYFGMADTLKKAEALSTDDFLVKAKWSKLLSGGMRSYRRCYGPSLILQMSGSGLVAPCGMLFNERYRDYHIGNIAEKRFRDIWKSDRYLSVMKMLSSDAFDARTMCGTLCLQHKVNEYLDALNKRKISCAVPEMPEPAHVNFI